MAVDIENRTVFEDLTDGIQKPPCEWDGTQVGGVQVSCELEAQWAVHWRERCENGQLLEPPTMELFCREHLSRIRLACTSPRAACSGCNEQIKSIFHLARHVIPL